MDHLILPIIKDFNPELSLTGRSDNHYDPLKMQITARSCSAYGKLRPDLAVLEGGYAIEQPCHMKMAIILGSAGLDYNSVEEPGYRPEDIKTVPGMAGDIERLVDELLQRWEMRDRVSPDASKISGHYYTRNKRIFYDTDYIDERQTERLRLCNNCPGYLVVDSNAKHGYGRSGRALCISVPHEACGKCRTEAAELYGDSKKDLGYDYIYLQDKHDDVFYRYNMGSHHEWHSEG